eukprot:747919-Hanusia_phi.AAC.6
MGEAAATLAGKHAGGDLADSGLEWLRRESRRLEDEMLDDFEKLSRLRIELQRTTMLRTELDKAIASLEVSDLAADVLPMMSAKQAQDRAIAQELGTRVVVVESEKANAFEGEVHREGCQQSSSNSGQSESTWSSARSSETAKETRPADEACHVGKDTHVQVDGGTESRRHPIQQQSETMEHALSGNKAKVAESQADSQNAENIMEAPTTEAPTTDASAHSDKMQTDESPPEADRQNAGGTTQAAMSDDKSGEESTGYDVSTSLTYHDFFDFFSLSRVAVRQEIIAGKQGSENIQHLVDIPNILFAAQKTGDKCEKIEIRLVDKYFEALARIIALQSSTVRPRLKSKVKPILLRNLQKKFDEYFKDSDFKSLGFSTFQDFCEAAQRNGVVQLISEGASTLLVPGKSISEDISDARKEVLWKPAAYDVRLRFSAKAPPDTDAVHFQLKAITEQPFQEDLQRPKKPMRGSSGTHFVLPARNLRPGIHWLRLRMGISDPGVKDHRCWGAWSEPFAIAVSEDGTIQEKRGLPEPPVPAGRTAPQGVGAEIGRLDDCRPRKTARSTPTKDVDEPEQSLAKRTRSQANAAAKK